ncbi:hypothetical protein COO60DRAFT_1644264 [Scenedesmus sp. NREL 46B-D3]|nr:hypothetical protein COO60DRAFT_1644264 [Scenedesmus sp. NREL 46B-D3]
MCGFCVYAAMPWLLAPDCDWVAMLDEDNWFAETHIQHMLQAAGGPSTEWVHSLRQVCSDAGELLVEDNCESLGLLRACWDRPGEHFVDTSCLLLRKDVARSLTALWGTPLISDRLLSAELVRTRKGATSLHHSLCYSIGPTHSSGITADYFRQGNAVLGQTWTRAKRPLYVFHFTPALTKQLLLWQQGGAKCRALEEWQLTQYDAMRSTFHLLDGFALEHSIPAGADVFISWGHLQQLPWSTLKRADIRKLTLLVESPNIRHTMQWDDELLRLFTTVFTFWRPMLQAKLPMCRFARMNTHWLDFDNPQHCQQLLHNAAYDGSVGIMLAHRPLRGKFVVRDTLLECQDHLRAHYMKDLRNAAVHGQGWDKAVLGPGVRIEHTADRFSDARSSVEILNRYTFAVVVENVDADGYVSEKLYDCLLAGCIPIYYGNNNELVGVPADLYIDLKQFASSQEQQDHLDTVDIAAFKRRIEEQREAVLRSVSANYFAELMTAAIITR